MSSPVLFSIAGVLNCLAYHEGVVHAAVTQTAVKQSPTLTSRLVELGITAEISTLESSWAIGIARPRPEEIAVLRTPEEIARALHLCDAITHRKEDGVIPGDIIAAGSVLEDGVADVAIFGHIATQYSSTRRDQYLEALLNCFGGGNTILNLAFDSCSLATESRVIHHFQQFITGAGLLDQFQASVAKCESATSWSASDKNLFSYPRCVSAFEEALLLPTIEERANAGHFALTALGAWVHLLQDMTSPAHVRDDPHSGPYEPIPTGSGASLLELEGPNVWGEVVSYLTLTSATRIPPAPTYQELMLYASQRTGTRFYSDDTTPVSDSIIGNVTYSCPSMLGTGGLGVCPDPDIVVVESDIYSCTKPDGTTQRWRYLVGSGKAYPGATRLAVRWMKDSSGLTTVPLKDTLVVPDCDPGERLAVVKDNLRVLIPEARDYTIVALESFASITCLGVQDADGELVITCTSTSNKLEAKDMELVVVAETSPGHRQEVHRERTGITDLSPGSPLVVPKFGDKLTTLLTRGTAATAVPELFFVVRGASVRGRLNSELRFCAGRLRWYDCVRGKDYIMTPAVTAIPLAAEPTTNGLVVPGRRFEAPTGTSESLWQQYSGWEWDMALWSHLTCERVWSVNLADISRAGGPQFRTELSFHGIDNWPDIDGDGVAEIGVGTNPVVLVSGADGSIVGRVDARTANCFSSDRPELQSVVVRSLNGWWAIGQGSAMQSTKAVNSRDPKQCVASDRNADGVADMYRASSDNRGRRDRSVSLTFYSGADGAVIGTESIFASPRPKNTAGAAGSGFGVQPGGSAPGTVSTSINLSSIPGFGAAPEIAYFGEVESALPLHADAAIDKGWLVAWDYDETAALDSCNLRPLPQTLHGAVKAFQEQGVLVARIAPTSQGAGASAGVGTISSRPYRVVWHQRVLADLWKNRFYCDVDGDGTEDIVVQRRLPGTGGRLTIDWATIDGKRGSVKRQQSIYMGPTTSGNLSMLQSLGSIDSDAASELCYFRTGVLVAGPSDDKKNGPKIGMDKDSIWPIQTQLVIVDP